MKNILRVTLLLISTLGYGQKRLLAESDYPLWNTISSGPISYDGNWLTYSTHYKGADTLFIRNSRTARLISLPSATHPQFSDDSRFVSYLSQDRVHLIGLQSGKHSSYSANGRHLFSSGGRYLILHDPAKGQLLLADLKYRKEALIGNVAEFVPDPTGRSAVLVLRNGGSDRMGMLTYSANLPALPIAEGPSGSFRNITWNAKGNHLAFYENDSTNTGEVALVLWRTRGGNTAPRRLLSCSANFPKNSRIATTSLYVSDDGERVFFDIASAQNDPDTAPSPSAVQIWKSNSLQLPGTTIKSAMKNKWSVWHPADGEIIVIESDEHPHAVLTGDKKNALLFNSSDYLPRFKFGEEYADMHLLDLDSGEKSLAISRQIPRYGQTVMSPTGKFICYFKDQDWWNYDIERNKHTCLTANAKATFSNASYDGAETAVAYPFGGWSAGDKQVILYDEFDIWLFAADGRSHRRITDGKNIQTRYRVYDDGLVSNSVGNVGGFSSKTIDVNQAVMITSENQHNLKQGISLWSRGKGLSRLVEAHRKIYSLQKIKHRNALTYFECNFDSPPALKMVEEGGKPEIIVQSNAQQSDFRWGRSELIYYESDGKSLKGALFYPAGYVEGKKYPLIVNIYEKLSHTLHDYVPPSGKSANGFSTTDLTQQGFFVLCPDIAYTINEAGPSALRSVTAAVKKAISGKQIDSARMGIMGHSFGGYETTYIIANSSLFKAAVAGAPVTDLKSFYLSVNNENRPNLQLVESNQLRLKKPFYGPELKMNSPIENIANVKTPLLLWTSDSDQVVPPAQSMEFHLGLWRLGKTSTMLVYPKEDHSLLDEENQEDLSKRVTEWFSHYLMDAVKPDWM